MAPPSISGRLKAASPSRSCGQQLQHVATAARSLRGDAAAVSSAEAATLRAAVSQPHAAGSVVSAVVSEVPDTAHGHGEPSGHRPGRATHATRSSSGRRSARTPARGRHWRRRSARPQRRLPARIASGRSAAQRRHFLHRDVRPACVRANGPDRGGRREQRGQPVPHCTAERGRVLDARIRTALPLDAGR